MDARRYDVRRRSAQLTRGNVRSTSRLARRIAGLPIVALLGALTIVALPGQHGPRSDADISTTDLMSWATIAADLEDTTTAATLLGCGTRPRALNQALEAKGLDYDTFKRAARTALRLASVTADERTLAIVTDVLVNLNDEIDLPTESVPEADADLVVETVHPLVVRLIARLPAVATENRHETPQH